MDNLSEDNKDSFQEINVPASRITRPEYLDWHMILDHELTQLSRPEIGMLASLGFVGLGAAITLSPQVMPLMLKPSGESLSLREAWDMAFLVGSIVLFGVCITISGLTWYRNKGLAEQIRARPKSS